MFHGRTIFKATTQKEAVNYRLIFAEEEKNEEGIDELSDMA